MKLEFQVKAIPTLVGLDCIPWMIIYTAPCHQQVLNPKKKGKKKKYVNSGTVSLPAIMCYLLCILSNVKSVQLVHQFVSFSKNKLLSGPVFFFCVQITCLYSRLLCCPSKWSLSTPLWISSVEGEWNINKAEFRSVSVAAFEDVLTFVCVVVNVACTHFILQIS